VQRKQRVRDPFEAADEQLGDEAEEKRAAAPDSKESPAALVDQDDIWDELKECLDDDVPTAEGSTMSEEEMDQHLASLFEPLRTKRSRPNAIAAPDPAPKKSKLALQDDLDFRRYWKKQRLLSADKLAWT
jgi:hypothetical protein